MGSWADAAEHIGTRTREEVERHYNEVYVDSEDWPIPVSFSASFCPKARCLLRNSSGALKQRMDATFDFDIETFQAKKKRRIEEIQKTTVGMFSRATSAPKSEHNMPLWFSRTFRGASGSTQTACLRPDKP